MFYAKLHFMKNMVCIILGALMVLSVQAQKRGYIYTTNGVDADYREIKNLNVVRGVDGEGFLQVHAIVGNDRWNVRCIRTDDTGTVIWMKEYNFRPHSGLDTSTCPFAVCHNLANDGYVIAGIWSMTFSYDHSSLESPFYIEIDDYGALIQAKRQRISMDTCFAPLKIKPSYEDQTYVVVGVSGNRMDKITSDYRAARVCKLDAQLNELPGAREIKSTYATSASIAANGIVYDAFNNVEVVNDGAGCAYVVSGCVTDDLYRADPSNINFGNYGRAVPFIAKMDTNLNIIWYKADYSIDSTYDHSIVTDVTYDQDRNSLYVIHMRSSVEGNFIALEVRELDYANGNDVQAPVLSTTFDGSTKFQNIDIPNYFLVNVFLSGEDLILVGYAMDDSTVIGPINSMDKIDPLIISLDKTNLSNFNLASCEISCVSFGFLSHQWVQGYLGYRYDISNGDFMVADSLATIPFTLINTVSHSPLIYSPEITVDGLLPGDSSIRYILAIAGAENFDQLHPSGEKFPFLYKIMNSPFCIDSNSSVEPSPFHELGSRDITSSTINFSDTLNSNVVVNDFDIFYKECIINGESKSIFPLEVDFIRVSRNEDLHYHVMNYYQDKFAQFQNWEIKYLFDLSGYQLQASQKYLPSGVYIAHTQNENSVTRMLKIFVY